MSLQRLEMKLNIIVYRHFILMVVLVHLNS